MPRRRTHEEAIRSRLITIRVTEAQHAKLSTQAGQQGLTLSGLAERLVTKGRVVMVNRSHGALEPETLLELKRIGNNLNQIAHAVNTNLPPAITLAATHMHGLLTLLVRHHYFASRLDAARSQEAANDSSAPHAREEFQRHADLHSSRP